MTPLDAMNADDIKSMKLATRIGEIKKNLLNEGESINDEWINLPSGKKVKQYFLVKQ